MAWSGGLDSTVLLHRLVQARRGARGVLHLRAVHVNHHLQPAAADFEQHCRRQARRWRVPLQVLDVCVATSGGASVEAEARRVRYAALQGVLQAGEVLLVAQHGDDQFETLLLALLRGAGPAGLAGMPAAMAFGEGLLLRPLLGETRAALAAEAQAAGLSWVEDPSNPDPRFDRNLLRQQVVPILRRRWPGLAAAAGRSARLCGEASGQLRRLARDDLVRVADGEGLEVAALRGLGAARQAQVVRLWLARQGAQLPDERRLLGILGLGEVAADATPGVAWGEWQVCRLQGRLLLQPRRRRRAVSRTEAAAWRWQEQPVLQVPSRGRLWLVADAHGDVDLDRLPPLLHVRWQPAGQVAAPLAGQRRLRKLFQSLGVPAPARGRLPLLCSTTAGDEAGALLAIAGLWVDPVLRSSVSTVRAGRFFWREEG